MFGLFGVKSRIRTLFMIYVAAKLRSPEMSERETLEIVVNDLIPPGKAIHLRKTGITGKQYLDGVFEDRQIDIDELIFHIICLEFPKKFPNKIDLEEMMRNAENNSLSEKDELKEEIKRQHQKFVS
ncbi:MAG: hypothetical protein AAB582_01915 [Patescibacteria group bacterium]